MTEPLRSFDDFYRVEYPRLLRVLSAAGSGAADALQEAFTKAAAAWPQVSAYEYPAAWVRRVAVRRMLNERRSTRRRDAALKRLAAVAPADSVDREELLDLTSAETAAAMDISAGAVRFHLHEARNRVRDILGAR